MNKVSVVSTTILCLLLGASAAAIAQHQPQGNSRGNSNPAPQMHSQPAAKPAPSPAARPQSRPQQSFGGAYHGGVQPNGPTLGGVHHSGVPQHQSQVHSGFAQSRAGSWSHEHQTWSQRGGYNGYRIPDSRFRHYFGHDHFFRIGGLPLFFVGGMPRFQYDGYWITILDPWPESWGPDWYETDDVYLDYTGDGYYLYDSLYPGFPIAVSVSF
jgi:hypothetical protein